MKIVVTYGELKLQETLVNTRKDNPLPLSVDLYMDGNEYFGPCKLEFHGEGILILDGGADDPGIKVAWNLKDGPRVCIYGGGCAGGGVSIDA